MLPLLATPGVHFFSLQMGPPRQQLEQSGIRGLITDLAPLIDDFADTAAVIQQLDLVLMTDSSVAHLTNALDRPIWNLLPLVPDWRWLANRDNTPWYPSMRLFRQTAYNQWDDVLARVRVQAVLAAWAARRRIEKRPAP